MLLENELSRAFPAPVADVLTQTHLPAFGIIMWVARSKCAA